MSILKRLKNMSVSMKATLAFGASSFALSGINYIATPIFTRILSASDYGVIAVYNSWYEIARVFATMTLIFPGILQVGLYEHSENRWKYLSSMLGVIVCCTGALAAAYSLLRPFAEPLLRLPLPLVVLMLLSCVFQSATTLWTTKQRYEYGYRIAVPVALGSAVFAQAVSVAAVLIARRYAAVNLAGVRLWSSGAVNITVGVILFCYILREGKTPVDLPLWKSTILVAAPLIPHYLSSVILHSTDKIMISQMTGDDKAGIYSLVATLSSLGVLFWRALSVTFSPFINAKLGERKFKDINDSTLPLLTIVGLTCFLGALTAPEIIRLMATREYLSGIYIIPPVVTGIFLHALYDIFSAVSFFHKKSARIMTASVVAALSNVILNYVCIRKFGFIAAGYTTMFSNLILTAMHYFNMRKIEAERIYDTKFIAFLVAAVSGGCLLCNLLYQVNSAARYALALVTLGVIFSQRRNVVTAVNRMKV